MEHVTCHVGTMLRSSYYHLKIFVGGHGRFHVGTMLDSSSYHFRNNARIMIGRCILGTMLRPSKDPDETLLVPCYDRFQCAGAGWPFPLWLEPESCGPSAKLDKNHMLPNKPEYFSVFEGSSFC